MLKTNSKKARENVVAYILQDRDYIEENYGIRTEDATPDEMMAIIYRIFSEEERHGIEENYGNPCFVIFEDWARGLALGSLFAYYCHSAVKDLGDILEETDEERAKYTEQQAEELLTRLIYREIEEGWRREVRREVDARAKVLASAPRLFK